MKKFIAIFIIFLAGCAGVKTLKINEFNSHIFSGDMVFIQDNLTCESSYLTDKFDTKNNEIYRCISDNNNITFTLESNGNDSDTLKQATLVWKNWHPSLNTKQSYTVANQFIAVFAKLYGGENQIPLVESFIEGHGLSLKSATYDIKVEKEKGEFFNTHIATVIFK